MRLAVFTKNRTNPAYGAARIGADRAAAAVGAEVQHYVPATPDDPVQQGALIDQALETKPEAFVFSAVHPSKVNAEIARIGAAGIPIVGFVNPVPIGRSVAYVGADDAQLGQEMAAYLFRHLGGGGGRVLMVTGPEDSVTSIERVKGFRAAVAQHPGIRVVGEIAGDYDRGVAYERAAAWIKSHGKPDACLVANDIMAIGVLTALEEAGVRCPVVGVNAIPQAIDAIRDGRMLATADFNAMQMAYVATECAVRHLRGQPVPAHLDLPVRIVDGSNWRAWDLPYEERALQPLETFWRPT